MPKGLLIPIQHEIGGKGWHFLQSTLEIGIGRSQEELELIWQEDVCQLGAIVEEVTQVFDTLIHHTKGVATRGQFGR